MSETKKPTKGTRVSLTKNQASEGIGRELVDLCCKWLDDGQLDHTELDELSSWLDQHASYDNPTINFLAEEAQRYLEDGVVHDWELMRMQAALMRVVPLEERKLLKEAVERRRLSVAKQQQELYELRAQDTEKYWEKVREVESERWSRQPPTDNQIDYIRDLGGRLPKGGSKLDASRLIDKLLKAQEAGFATNRNSKPSGCFGVLALGFGTMLAIKFLTHWT